jgi:hypothetical protein
MVRGGAWFSLDLAGSSGRSYSRAKISASVYTPPHVGAMLSIDFEAVAMAEEAWPK